MDREALEREVMGAPHRRPFLILFKAQRFPQHLGCWQPISFPLRHQDSKADRDRPRAESPDAGLFYWFQKSGAVCL